jgi:hypothetical protein
MKMNAVLYAKFRQQSQHTLLFLPPLPARHWFLMCCYNTIVVLNLITETMNTYQSQTFICLIVMILFNSSPNSSILSMTRDWIIGQT